MPRKLLSDELPPLHYRFHRSDLDQLYVLVDEIEEDGLIYDGSYSGFLQWQTFWDPTIFLAVSQAMHFAYHLQELLAELHFDVAKDMAQEIDNGKQTGADGLFSNLFFLFCPIHLATLSGVDETF